jgi:hypothetical protein
VWSTSLRVRTAVGLYWSHRADGLVSESRESEARGPYDFVAHHGLLQTPNDVLAASDDVLLEANGFPNVKNWGWLYFMLHNLEWFHLAASNWGVPTPVSYYGQRRRSDSAEPDDDERMILGASYFLGMMCERGRDPLAELRAFAEQMKAKCKEQRGEEISEEGFVEWLRGHDLALCAVYACESFEIRPEVKPPTEALGKCLYPPDYAAEHLMKMRAAHARWSRG